MMICYGYRSKRPAITRENGEVRKNDNHKFKTLLYLCLKVCVYVCVWGDVIMDNHTVLRSFCVVWML